MAIAGAGLVLLLAALWAWFKRRHPPGSQMP
jgi:LPXTG-motif cell wall-anchored protein